MTTFDDIAEGMRARRVAAGNPSFAEIALRIARIREERKGVETSGRPARTTVYDAFRAGRRRLDTALVLDIVRALGADEDEVALWAERCRAAHLAPAPEPEMNPEPEPAPESAPESQPEPAAVLPPSLAVALWVCLGCVGVNLVGRALVVVVDTIPLYLDMVGTAVAAVVLGPWWGVGVGLSTNLFGIGFSGSVSAPFALVNMAGALVWGYGVRRWRMGRTVPRFFALNCLAALACSALAVPLILFLVGETGNGADGVAASILLTVEAPWLAVATSNILTSLADKTISGFVALLAFDLLPRSVTGHARPLMPFAAPALPSRS